MRAPVNPIPGGRQRATSSAVAVTVEVFESQPGSPGAGGTNPIDVLSTVSASFSDDASRPIQRTISIQAASAGACQPGMWVRPSVGVATLEPIVYRLPAMVVTDVVNNMGHLGGATVLAADPGEVLNGRPYEADTTATGTLRSLVAAACTLALTRPTDVSGVPATPVPVGTVLEFGMGRWDGCIKVADDLGVAIRFTDAGDVVGVLRSGPAPSPAGSIERAVVDGGVRHRDRIPTSAVVLVTRGSERPGLVGRADIDDVTGETLPPWYLPNVVSDRHEGDINTTQVQADQLATDLLRVRVSQREAFERLPILPAPWLEAGVDVVTFDGSPFYVRALNLDLPTMRTDVSLRKVV